MKSGIRVFKPSFSAYSGRVGIVGAAVVGIIALLMVASAVTGHWNNRVLAAALTVAGLEAVVAAYMINVRGEVGPQEVWVRGLSGIARRWSRTDIKGCAGFSVMFPGIGRPLRLFLAYGEGHRTLFTPILFR